MQLLVLEEYHHKTPTDQDWRSMQGKLTVLLPGYL